MNEIKVVLHDSDEAEYYQFAEILKAYGIENKIVEKTGDGNEMGFGFSELIVLLPVLVPVLVEFRKALESYLNYKKSRVSKVDITLEKGNKKLHINTENSELPDIDNLKSFFE